MLYVWQQAAETQQAFCLKQLCTLAWAQLQGTLYLLVRCLRCSHAFSVLLRCVGGTQAAGKGKAAKAGAACTSTSACCVLWTPAAWHTQLDVSMLTEALHLPIAGPADAQGQGFKPVSYLPTCRPAPLVFQVAAVFHSSAGGQQ